MTDKHEPDEHSADDAASPPERAGSEGLAASDRSADTAGAPSGTSGRDRRGPRPPIAEGPTVPLKRPPSPSPPAAEPDREEDGEVTARLTPPPADPGRDELGASPVPPMAELAADPGRDEFGAGSTPPMAAPAVDPGRDEVGTRLTPPAVAPAVEPDRYEDDEVTTRLTPPAVDDEPTVERPKPALRRPDDGGATRRLLPSVVVPGPTSDTPGMSGPEDAGRSIAEPFPVVSASDETAGGAARGGRVAGAEAADATAGRDRADRVEAEPDRAEPDRAERDRAERDRAERDPAGDDDAEVPVGSPDVVTTGTDVQVLPGGGAPRVPGKVSPFKKLVSAGVLIWVLLALFGFTLVVQLRSNNSDEGLASARQDDLVRILSDLEARDTRLQAEITALETSQRQLTSGVAGRQAALAEAEKRADELGLLAGTVAGQGHGLDIKIDGVRASAVLNAVQELRGAGGEVMQLGGANGEAVRIVASTYFVDAEGGGIVADGKRLTGPYRLLVIGVPQTMQTALEIPGGVVASVKSGGGSVTMEQRDSVEVTALREATSLQYARPVS